MKILNVLKSIDYEDIAIRAIWTFLQAFLAVFIFTGESFVELLFDGDWMALQALAVSTFIGAVAAGLSALKTVILEVVRNLKAGEN